MKRYLIAVSIVTFFMIGSVCSEADARHRRPVRKAIRAAVRVATAPVRLRKARVESGNWYVVRRAARMMGRD